MLRHWSRGRTDPPGAEGTPRAHPVAARGESIFSPASPSKGEEPSSRLPKPPCSSRTTWLPRSIEGTLETQALVLKAVTLTPALSEPQKPHWDLLWWVLPPLRAFPLRTCLLPHTGLVSAEPSLAWGFGGGGAATGEGEGGRCLGPQGAFISPQPQTYTPKAVLHLLLEALPPRDKCPPSCIFQSTLPVGWGVFLWPGRVEGRGVAPCPLRGDLGEIRVFVAVAGEGLAGGCKWHGVPDQDTGPFLWGAAGSGQQQPRPGLS